MAPYDDAIDPTLEAILEEEKREQEGRHQHQPKDAPAVAGEEDVSGSAPRPDTDDDVGEMVEEVLGDEPKPGQTIGDIINEAEESRHHAPEREEPEEKA